MRKTSVATTDSSPTVKLDIKTIIPNLRLHNSPPKSKKELIEAYKAQKVKIYQDHRAYANLVQALASLRKTHNAHLTEMAKVKTDFEDKIKQVEG